MVKSDVAIYTTFDAILKEAVIANIQINMEAMPFEEDILNETPFSDAHNNKMDKILSLERLNKNKNLSKSTIIKILHW